MQTLDKLYGALQQNFAKSQLSVAQAEITIVINPEDLLASCLLLRDASELQFDQLIDLCGVDYLQYGIDEWATASATSEGFSRGVMQHETIESEHPRTARFAVVYHLLSTQLNQRVRLKVFTPGDPPHVPSVLEIWKVADWYEREAFDLFGIIFDGHLDLRRILTDYGFIGHPFRKDFPLIGQVEMRYDALAARVVYEPVSIKPRTLVPKVIRQLGHT